MCMKVTYAGGHIRRHLKQHKTFPLFHTKLLTSNFEAIY